MKKEENKFILWLKQKLGAQNGELSGGNCINKNDLLNFASTFNVPEKRGADSVWEGLSKRIEEETLHEITNPNKSKIWIYSIAASVALIIGLTITLSNIKEVIICERGQKLNYILPDSSVVILNADSKLSFNKYTYIWNRELYLEGEAFFMVEKGSLFEVHAQNTKTTVLGTSFNIFSRENNLEVSCKTGKVSVEINNYDDKKVLNPGYKVRLLDKEVLSEVIIVNKENIAKWQTGKFSFSKVPLSDVLLELERQFDIRIECKDCKKSSYTGHFYNDNLEEALKMICIPMQMEYKIKNSTVQLF